MNAGDCAFRPVGGDVMPQIMLFVTVGILVAGQAAGHSLSAASIAAPVTRTTESPLDLVWDAPPECPHGDAIKSDVLRLAGGSAVDSRRIRVWVVVRRNAAADWTLALATELDGDTGERVLSGQSCRSVSDAATLTLALVLNPEIARAPAAPSRNEAGALQPVQPVQLLQPVQSLIDAWLMGTGAGLQTGLLEDISPAFALALGVARGPVSVRLMPSYTPEQRVWVVGRPDVGARVRAGTAALLVCWALAHGRGILAPCLGYDITMLHGRGIGVLQPREQTVYWSSAEIGIMAGIHVNRSMCFQLSGLGLLSLNRPGLYLDDVGIVTRPAYFGIRAFVSIELAFR
jgi:hypothetical protein